MRRMMRSEPDDRNQKVAECYGKIHPSYELGEYGDLRLDLVQVLHVCRPCMITIDSYRFDQEYGKKLGPVMLETIQRYKWSWDSSNKRCLNTLLPKFDAHKSRATGAISWNGPVAVIGHISFGVRCAACKRKREQSYCWSQATRLHLLL